MSSYTYKFFTVSLSNTFVDMVVFNGLFWIIGGTTYIPFFIILKSIAFLVAVTNSYVWNNFWVFRNVEGFRKRICPIKKFGVFFGVSVVALIVNVSVASIVFMFIRDFAINEWYVVNISIICGSIAGLGINFRGSQKLFIKK